MVRYIRPHLGNQLNVKEGNSAVFLIRKSSRFEKRVYSLGYINLRTPDGL